MSEAMKDFIKGIGQVLDLGGTLVPRSSRKSPAQADYEALSSDWHKVGDDIRRSIFRFRGENTAIKQRSHEERR